MTFTFFNLLSGLINIWSSKGVLVSIYQTGLVESKVMTGKTNIAWASLEASLPHLQRNLWWAAQIMYGWRANWERLALQEWFLLFTSHGSVSESPLKLYKHTRTDWLMEMSHWSHRFYRITDSQTSKFKANITKRMFEQSSVGWFCKVWINLQETIIIKRVKLKMLMVFNSVIFLEECHVTCQHIIQMLKLLKTASGFSRPFQLYSELILWAMRWWQAAGNWNVLGQTSCSCTAGGSHLRE